mgnify:CR=1 FL=1
MKKSELKMMIRQIVREEVALTMKEVIKEIIGGGDKQQIKPKSKPKPKYYSKNKVLNDVLNETAMVGKDNEWETLGGSTYTTDKMNEVVDIKLANNICKYLTDFWNILDKKQKGLFFVL